MQEKIEQELLLDKVMIQVATFSWEGFEEAPSASGYRISQRLSDDHAPLQLGNLSREDILPRVNSVGFLPPEHPVVLFPIQTPLRVLFCIFDEQYFETTTGVTRQQWQQQVESLVLIRNSRLETLMQEIYTELTARQHGYELAITACSNMIMVELARYAKQRIDAPVQQKGASVLAAWHIRRILDRIHTSDQLGYPSLRELAELCAMSEGHLARSFKQATGWQIHKYISEDRIRKARLLLSQPELSCEEIAKRLDYRSAAYFSTAFRNKTGQTPTAYRKQLLMQMSG